MNTLAWRGLEEPAHASCGLEEPFFQLCCCVSFWFWREIGFGCTYLCTWSTIQLWCCVSFFVGGCAIIITTGKKRYSLLSGGCAIIITTGKKRYSHLSGGCAIIITTVKKRYSRLSGRCAIMSVFLVAIVIFVLV